MKLKIIHKHISNLSPNSSPYMWQNDIKKSVSNCIKWDTNLPFVQRVRVMYGGTLF